jgi:hypothetical protein
LCPSRFGIRIVVDVLFAPPVYNVPVPAAKFGSVEYSTL